MARGNDGQENRDDRNGNEIETISLFHLSTRVGLDEPVEATTMCSPMCSGFYQLVATPRDSVQEIAAQRRYGYLLLL